MIFSMRKYYRVIFLLSVLLPSFAKAQTMDCEQTIAYATEEFNAGHFHSVPSILNDCLNRLNRDQRQRAHLLLTQTYLLLDDPIGAQRSYLEVLSANPEFVPSEQLHAIDVVYLSKRFTATPKFSWFVHAGTNVSPVKVILNNRMFEAGLNQAQEQHRYTLRPGYNFGGGGEFSYNDNLKVRMELNFLQAAYRLEASNQSERDRRSLIERQTSINVPLYLCYSDNVGKYRPYGYAGISVSHLVVAKASIVNEKVERIGSSGEEPNEETESREVPSPDLDYLKRRNSLNQSLIFGGGIKYKLGLDFLFVDVRYSAGLKNVVEPDHIYADYSRDKTSAQFVDSGLPMAFGHVDDYFRLDNLSITFGFLRPLYKPRELKRVRTGSVLRKINRGK